MNLLLWIGFLLLSVLVVLINIIACYIIRTAKDEPARSIQSWPRVAVLIAARNEASNLPRCFQALEQLDYPAAKLSIWIGNDDSSDQTLHIAKAWCGAHANRQVIDIRQNIGHARGKANVLAQLARHAAPRADYFFITDADVVVNPGWIRQLLGHFKPGTGIVNGTTVVEGSEKEAQLQRYDWAFGLGLAKAFSELPAVGKTLTAIGNNMAVSREAYEAVGGYESIPFSITEDYELHHQLNMIGYKSVQIACPGVKARTLPARGWRELLHQRRRWMHGAMQLPLPMVAILVLQALFFPAILVILFWNPWWGLGILLAKLLSQALLIRFMLQRLDEPPAFPLAGYEIYSMLLNMSMIFFYFMPIPLRWKGRNY